MNPPEQKYIELALDAIEQISVLSSSFRNQVPTNNEDFEKFLFIWARSLERASNYPDFVFHDAVPILFSTKLGLEFQIMPYHFLEACKMAMDQAKNDPTKAREIENHREERRAKLDARVSRLNQY